MAGAVSEDKTDRQETESVADEDDPAVNVMCGIVEKYEDNIITIRDTDDDMRYDFFTDNSRILEGYSMEGAWTAEEDLTIAVDDRVEIKYRGPVGDENPAEAVKIVVITTKYVCGYGSTCVVYTWVLFVMIQNR